MSRCFPFPPPGYKKNGACSEDLIKSIKLQKERDEAKEQRKKDKRKRKEKRRERKERKKKEANSAHHRDGKVKECNLKNVESYQLEKIKTDQGSGRLRKVGDDENEQKEANSAHHRDGKVKECKLKNVESYQLEKIKTDQGSGCLRKVGDDENEQIERSGITEEHDQPFFPTEPCCLSDGTQSSNKRKRIASPSSSDHGTAIKIRLPLRKHRDHEELQQEDYGPDSAGSKGITKPSNEDSRHQSQGRKDSEFEHTEYEYLIRERGRMASLYNSLFQNWTPCALQLKEFELEEEDWLSTSKRQEQTQATKKVKSIDDAPGFTISTQWPPRAQYLPEADIYALPYTVPF